MEKSLPEYGPSYNHLAPHAVGAFVMTIVFLVVTLVFTLLRICVRRITSLPFFPSGWVFLAAEVIYVAYSAVTFVTFYKSGVGHHFEDVGTAQLQLGLKLLLVIQITYALCMVLLKVSICLLYIQIFSQRWLQLCAYGIISLSACWATFTILIGLLICRPLSATWDPPSGKCGDENAALSSVSGVELIIDVFIILLPLPVIWRLHTTTVQKITTSTLFCLGLITIVVTGVRLNVTLNLDFRDFSFSVIKLYELTIAELGVAVMVTAGMCLSPLVEKIFLPRRWESKYGSGKSSNSWGSKLSGRTNLLSANHQSAVETDIVANPGEEMPHFTRGRHADSSVTVGNWKDSDNQAVTEQGIIATKEFSQKSERIGT